MNQCLFLRWCGEQRGDPLLFSHTNKNQITARLGLDCLRAATMRASWTRQMGCSCATVRGGSYGIVIWQGKRIISPLYYSGCLDCMLCWGAASAGLLYLASPFNSNVSCNVLLFCPRIRQRRVFQKSWAITRLPEFAPTRVKLLNQNANPAYSARYRVSLACNSQTDTQHGLQWYRGASVASFGIVHRRERFQFFSRQQGFHCVRYFAAIGCVFSCGVSRTGSLRN